MRIRTYEAFVCDQSEGRGDLHAVTVAVNDATPEQLAACDAIAAKVRGVQFTAGEGRYVVRQTPTARHKWRHYGEADAEHVAAKAAKLAEQFREGLGVKRGPKPDAPWLSRNSLKGGLPRTRAAWLARVFDALDSTASYSAADEALSVPRETATRWCAWLRAEQVAGRLPEREAPLPSHVSADALRGHRPSPEQARAASALGVEARRRKREQAAAKKAAPKKRRVKR